jgi:hypothetical protein
MWEVWPQPVEDIPIFQLKQQNAEQEEPEEQLSFKYQA